MSTRHYPSEAIPQPKWDKKNQKWTLSIMIDGRRKQFASRTPKMPGKRECRERCIEWLERGCDDKSNTTFEKAFERFLEDYQTQHGENVCIFDLKKHGRLYLLPKLGKKKCRSITIEEWQSVISEAKPQERLRKDGSKYTQCEHLSKKYLSNIRGTISAFTNWAFPRHYIDYLPGPQLYIPNAAQAVGRDILQLSDIETWFEHPTGLWYERALMFELLTGWRPGEVIGLQKSDYNPITGIITINRSVDTKQRITPGKNKNAHRSLELTPEVRSIIETQLEETEHLNSEWIFCSPTGAVAHQESIRRQWKRITSEVGISSNTSPYSLRHTFYTHTEAYLPDRIIKSIFGHANQTDSHNLYGKHDIDGELHEAAKRLSVTPLYEIASKNKKAR